MKVMLETSIPMVHLNNLSLKLTCFLTLFIFQDNLLASYCLLLSRVQHCMIFLAFRLDCWDYRVNQKFSFLFSPKSLGLTYLNWVSKPLITWNFGWVCQMSFLWKKSLPLSPTMQMKTLTQLQHCCMAVLCCMKTRLQHWNTATLASLKLTWSAKHCLQALLLPTCSAPSSLPLVLPLIHNAHCRLLLHHLL